MELTGRERAQNRTLTKEPARAWGGLDPIAKIASVAVVDGPAVCPSCLIVSRLVHISDRDALTATEASIIPSMAVGDVLRKAQCILCTAAEIPTVRAQEAHAGHIWFLIGDTADTIPPQAALNQHFWTAIANHSPRQRAAARNNLLELAASKAFGGLQLPHLVISTEERTWLMGAMRKALGEDAGAILGEEAMRAFIDQLGVPLLVRSRIPKPKWAPNVRFMPTPDGIEAYRKLFIVPVSAAPEAPAHRRGK